MELLLWATLAVVLAVVGRRVRGRVRARHARAWAAGARREMVALLVDEREELDQQGHVTVVGDVLEWSCDIWRWRTPLHLPGDAVCTVLEDEHRQETWVLEACQGPDGRRLLVGVPLAAVDALDALRRSSRPTGADGVVPGGRPRVAGHGPGPPRSWRHSERSACSAPVSSGRSGSPASRWSLASTRPRMTAAAW